MTEAVRGINQILLYRVLSEAGIIAGTKLAFQTEHEVSESMSSDSVPTKDGAIQIPGVLEGEISMTSILAKGDIMIGKLKDAMRNREIVEVWDIDKTDMTGAHEIDTITITAGASTAGQVTITLNGVAFPVAVLASDTAAAVAARIRLHSFAGWTVSGANAVCIFTKNSGGTVTATTFSGGTTGATGAVVITVAGTAQTLQFPATYYQGYLTEYSKTAGAEDTVEVSFTYVINAHGVDGNATLSEEQAEVVQYLFKDTTIEA